jgi:hypothetical protein
MAANAEASGWMPGLLAVIVALLAWSTTESWKDELAPLKQQKQAAQRLLARPAGALAGLKEEQKTLAQMRDMLTLRLRSDSDLQAARAELFYAVREKCDALKLSCTVRLSDAQAAGATRSAEPDSLEALGVSRVRAVVSGGLADHEITALLRAFTEDTRVRWRIGRVQVRGKGFELELERHLVLQGAS